MKPTVANLRALVEKHHGVLEEDDAGSMTDSRVFQIVAPAGKVWVNADLRTRVCIWARGSSAHAQRYNADALDDVAECVAAGTRDFTAEEAELYAED